MSYIEDGLLIGLGVAIAGLYVLLAVIFAGLRKTNKETLQEMRLLSEHALNVMKAGKVSEVSQMETDKKRAEMELQILAQAYESELQEIQTRQTSMKDSPLGDPGDYELLSPREARFYEEL